MADQKNHFQPLYDEKQRLLGVVISPELWMAVEKKVNPIFDAALASLTGQEMKKAEEPPEPMKNFEQFKEYWDFPYELPYDVHCDHCGQKSENWLEDDPRKFRLRNANLGGLLCFTCMQCNASIAKKHFKKHVAVECSPRDAS